MENPVLQRERESRELGERIAELAAHLHAGTYRLLVLLHEFNEANGWQGWRSCAEWLSWRTGLGMEAAREKVRVARALPGLPEISEALARGEISYSKVRAVTRIASEKTESMLLMIARHGTASQVERVVRGYRRAEPEETSRANEQHAGRYLSLHRDERGNLVVRGRLPPELGARFEKALDAAVDSVTQGCRESGETSTFLQRRADALVTLADGALAAGLPGRRAADIHQVVIHVDAEVLEDPAADGRSELEHGPRVSAETSRRLACDGSVVTIREDACGEPLSVGRRRRTVPPSLRRALESRDGECRFPGCSRTRYLQAHHVRHWAAGGDTCLGNLVLLCSFHHRQLHEGGFRLEREADGPLRFVSPAGVEWQDAPPPSGASFAVVQAHPDHIGIAAGSLPTWNGDRLDLGFTVSELLWRAGVGREDVGSCEPRARSPGDPLQT